MLATSEDNLRCRRSMSNAGELEARQCIIVSGWVTAVPYNYTSGLANVYTCHQSLHLQSILVLFSV